MWYLSSTEQHQQACFVAQNCHKVVLGEGDSDSSNEVQGEIKETGETRSFQEPRDPIRPNSV